MTTDCRAGRVGWQQDIYSKWFMSQCQRLAPAFGGGKSRGQTPGREPLRQPKMFPPFSSARISRATQFTGGIVAKFGARTRRSGAGPGAPDAQLIGADASEPPGGAFSIGHRPIAFGSPPDCVSGGAGRSCFRDWTVVFFRRRRGIISLGPCAFLDCRRLVFRPASPESIGAFAP